MRSARLFLLVLLALAAWRLWVLYPRLPARVASHFATSGEADGWMDRRSFVIVSEGLTVVVAGIFLGIGWLVRRLPDPAINLPHREHWLAPERRAATLANLEARLLWMGCTGVLFTGAISELSVRVTLDGTHRLPSGAILVLGGGFAAVIVIQSVALILAYHRVR